MFSAIPLPENYAAKPGGTVVPAMAAINSLSKQMLENKMQQMKNQIQAPYAQMAVPFAQAELEQKQAIPGLTKAQTQQALGAANQANAQAGYLGSETGINQFKLQNPAYINPEAWMYTSPDYQRAAFGSNPQPNTGNPNANPMANIPAGPDNMQQNNLAPPTPMSPMGQNNFQQNPINLPAPRSMAELKGMQMRAAVQAALAKSQEDIKNNNAFNFKNAPKDEQEAMLAQLHGAGLDPYDAMQRLTSGESVRQVLQDEGFDPQNPPPLAYVATDEDRKNVNLRKTALAQVNNLSDWVGKSLGPYSRTIMGYSPRQIVEAMNGMNKEQQANFLAARMIMPDLAGFRTTVAGLRAGRGMIKEMTDRAMAESHLFQGLIAPDVFERAQQIATDRLSGSARAANDVILKGFGKGNKTKENESITKNWVRKDGKLVLEG